MGRKGITLAMLLLCICIALASCGKNDSPTESNSSDAILGTWETVSYFTSGGYYAPMTIQETFTFGKDESFSWNNDGTITTGQFKFTPETGILACKESRGWDFTIFVDFEDADNAVFDISGKVQSQKVKAKRTRKDL